MTSSDGSGSTYPPATHGSTTRPGQLPPIQFPTGGYRAPSTRQDEQRLDEQRQVEQRKHEQSAAGAANEQAASVAGTAADAAKNVAGVAKEQAGQVAAEARQQVKHLMGLARTELTDQAQVQQQRVAGGLHSVGHQLRAMADGSPEPGPATDLAHQAADKAHQIAGWLENRDPGSVVEEVRSFARQRPGTFLAIALGAGVLAGRLARGLAAYADDTAETSTNPAPAPLTSGYHSWPELAIGAERTAVNGDPVAAGDWPTEWSDGR